LLSSPLMGLGQFQKPGGRPGGVILPGGKKRPFPQPTPQPKPKETDHTGQESALQLNEKSEYRQFIGAARDCIKDKVWNDAAEALQTILDNKEDFYARVEEVDQRTGAKTARWTSVKFEANKLLGSMPKEGLDVYEVKYGVKARQLYDEAKKSGNIELLGDVAARYLYTSIGPEANDLLASYFLDRGQYFSAALRYERLLVLPKDRLKNRDLTVFKAALAYRRAGDQKNFQKVWGQLQPDLVANGGLKVGNQLVTTDDLEKLLNDQPQIANVGVNDWPLVRGDTKNDAQASGSPALLDEILWRRPTVKDKFEGTGIVDEGTEAENWIKEAMEETRKTQTIPIMPGFFPIAVNGKLIYRTYNGIAAVNLQEYVDTDGEKVKAGELVSKTTNFDGVLATILSKPKTKGTIDSWLRQDYKNAGGNFLSLVYENSLVGTLSSDQTNVYAVDDLAVPLPPQHVMQLFNPNMFGPAGNIPPDVKERVMENSLHAYNIATGKVAWQLKGKDRKTKNPTEFYESHFLGVPLPVGGKLYVLNEKNNGDLRLVTLDPATGAIIPPIQNIGTVDQNSRITHDPNRRIHAVHMAYGEGILICPTNAGEVLGIDLLSRTLAWAYPYREKRSDHGTTQPGFPGPIGFQPLPLTPATWKVAPPVIAEGKVVFTAPDAHSLHCLNLRDGILAWKVKKSPSDLFLAGVWDGKVVVIGKNSCTLRDLSSGTLLRSITTGGLPAGQGVASGNIYYLPLQSGEICAIDIERGGFMED
jgi:outer membrane protein assembly factor BamB